MRNIKVVIISLLLSVFSFSIYAHDNDPLFNQVNLQAQAEREIPNDQLTVMLAVEEEGKEAAKIANKINQDMDWALKIVGKKNAIVSRTQAYNTHPIYDKRTVIGWRAIQQLELKSTNITELSELVGILQSRLQVKNMRFSPTRETRVQYENELIEEAMVAFKQRVEIVKKHMDDKNVRIVNMHVNTGGGHNRPIYAESRMMAMDSKSAPAIEAGTSQITVTVSGSVQFF
ncbi:MAG: putative secreted protein [Gammaproteobacteria bacterium]|jgi:predicted secreted protein